MALSTSMYDETDKYGEEDCDDEDDAGEQRHVDGQSQVALC